MSLNYGPSLPERLAVELNAPASGPGRHEFDLLMNSPHEALQTLFATTPLLTDMGIVTLGAGPLENLLARWHSNSVVMDEFKTMVANEPRFAAAASCVWDRGGLTDEMEAFIQTKIPPG